MGRAQHEGAAPYISSFQLFGNTLLIMSRLQHGSGSGSGSSSSSSSGSSSSRLLSPSVCPLVSSQLWILGVWLAGWLAGCAPHRTAQHRTAPGISRWETEDFLLLLLLFMNAGRAEGERRAREVATLLRLHVFSPWTEDRPSCWCWFWFCWGTVRLLPRDNSPPFLSPLPSPLPRRII